MKTIYVIVLLTFIGLRLNAQKVTNYYDFSFNKIKRKNAAFKEVVSNKKGLNTISIIRIYNNKLYRNTIENHTDSTRLITNHFFNGKIDEIIVENKLNNRATIYDLKVNGDTVSIKEFTGGKKDGKVIFYDNSDSVSFISDIESYAMDKKYGSFIEYNSSGLIIDSCFYVNDTIVGKRFYYHDNGSIDLIKSYKQGQADGEFTSYYDNGAKRSVFTYVNGDLVGDYISYYEDGSKKSFEVYVNGKEQGESYGYYRSGKIRYKYLYDNGEKNGLAIKYDTLNRVTWSANYKYDNIDGELLDYWDNGILKRKEIYKDDIMQEGACYDHKGNDTAYYPLEQMPMFVGGEDELYAFLGKNIRYPLEAKENGISGRIYIQFTVEKDGAITEINELNYLGAGLNKESVRVIKKMPKWIAGEQDGHKVRVKFTLPLSFQLR